MVGLVRIDSTNSVPLSAQAPSGSLLTGNQINHLTLACVGATISASVNGTQVASAQDSTYSQGTSAIAAGPNNAATQQMTTDVRLTNLQLTGAPPAPGTVLVSDNFADPSTGILTKVSTAPESWKIGYTGGEYQIATVNPVVGADDSVGIPGSYTDASLSVDVRALPDTDVSALIGLSCRRRGSGSSSTGYRMYLIPALNQWQLGRIDAGKLVTLTNIQVLASAPSSGIVRHLRLNCSGSTIAVSIDGNQVFSTQDATYRAGSLRLDAGIAGASVDGFTGVVTPGGYPGNVDFHLTNLVVGQP
jgi:hypothetical protein